MRDVFSRIAPTVLLLTGLGLVMITVDTSADEVSRWVDENGVTHFTSTQFAPADAQRVQVADANTMDVPDTSVLTRTEDRGGPAFSKVTLPEKKNKKGWRPRKESLYTGRKHKTRYLR